MADGALKMTTISLQDAQANLPDVIDSLHPGEEITITRLGEPVAQVKKAARTSWPCQAGTAKNSILWIASDFDAPFEEFREYME
jgi:antitoxin (DNA-binding transcriptional repressor) of toxin-antitoxin stability system